MATAKQLVDIMECPICTEVYTDPRILPCGHMYCLKCIERWINDKQPGDKLACPLCRKEFTPPSNGVSDLPKNFFAVSVLQMKELSSVESKISRRGEFFERLQSDLHNIAVGVEKCREMRETLEKDKIDFIEQFAKTKVEVSAKANQLQQMIDVHEEQLLIELSSVKDSRMNEIECLQKEIERQLSSMESYKKYVDELRQKETACDIARAASDLHDRADELLMFDVIERKLIDVGHADVTFSSSNFVIDDVSKTLGQLHLNVIKEGELLNCTFPLRRLSDYVINR